LLRLVILYKIISHSVEQTVELLSYNPQIQLSDSIRSNHNRALLRASVKFERKTFCRS